MQATMQTPSEQRVHEAFEALMWALAEPGEVRDLPRAGFEDFAESLIDLEVAIYTAEPQLFRLFRHLDAEPTSVDEADYLFFPTIGESELADLEEARTGEPLYPDRAATAFLGASIGTGTRLCLSGPGIAGNREISLGDLPPALWDLRRNVCRYPLGWDLFFVDGRQVVGLPRSTTVEVL